MTDPAADPLFLWTAHPAAARKRRSLVVAMAMVAFSLAVGVLYGSVGYGALCAVALFGSSASYWTPRRYAVFEDRLEIRYSPLPKPVAYSWKPYRSCVADRDSLCLCQTSDATSLSKVRGLRIMLPDDPTVAEWIRNRIETRVD